MKVRLFTLLSLIVVVALLVPGGAVPTAAQSQPAAPVAPVLSEVEGPALPVPIPSSEQVQPKGLPPPWPD
jgi:hypothetical protein